MEENAGNTSTSKSFSIQPGRKWKRLLSPTSSFVQFTDLKTYIYTDADKEEAELNLYEPYENRKMKTPTTNYETTVHLLKGIVGSGILGMPKAFHHSGVAIGVPGIIILAIFYCYGIHVMLRMQYLQCKLLKTPFLTLACSMKIAFLNGPDVLKRFAWLAPYMVDLFLVVNQIGICVTYIAFTAESFKNVLEPRLLDDVNLRWYMIGIFIPVLLINYLRNLKSLTSVSLVADIFYAAAIILLFYYLFSDDNFKLNEVNMVSNYTTWPLFVGTSMFAVQSVGVMITLEHNMENPENLLGWCGIFPWCTVFVVLLYMALGLCTYFKFGEDTKDTIIGSLPNEYLLTDCVYVFIGLAICGSYPLECFVSLEVIWANYLTHFIKDQNKECCMEFIMRTVVILLIFALAIAIPDIDLFMSLVGAFCLSMLGLVIPFLLELCTKWPDRLCYCYLIFYKDIVLILIGLFMLISCTYTCMYELISE